MCTVSTTACDSSILAYLAGRQVRAWGVRAVGTGSEQAPSDTSEGRALESEQETRLLNCKRRFLK